MRSWPQLAIAGILLAGFAPACTSHRVHGQMTFAATESRERAVRREFQARMRALLAANDYARLTHVADSLRATRARFEDDHYALLDFLDAFSAPGTPQEADAYAWQASLRQLEGWREQMPNSALPSVALAETWVNFGWKARGHGAASGVREAGWVGFEHAMGCASQALDEVSRISARGIEWYLVAGRVALGQGWTTAESESLFRCAVALDPTCDFAYWQRADFLLPRWYGQPGEWEAWLERAVAPLPPEDADRVYAAVCTQMEDFHRNLYEETRASWPRVARGFRVQLRLHPGSQWLAQEFAFHAMLNGDLAAAQEGFRRTGPRYDLAVWRTKELFTESFALVRQEVPNTPAHAVATR